jgi:hypothetical protein
MGVMGRLGRGLPGVDVFLAGRGRAQIVLCANNIYGTGNMTDVVTHELIHAFDNCRAKVDFRNIEHLACTEVSSGHRARAPHAAALLSAMRLRAGSRFGLQA